MKDCAALFVGHFIILSDKTILNQGSHASKDQAMLFILSNVN